MKRLADVFPKSLSLLLKMANTTEQNFTKFVVCRKCHALYKYDNCREKIGTQIQTKSCGNANHQDGCPAIVLFLRVLKLSQAKYFSTHTNYIAMPH